MKKLLFYILILSSIVFSQKKIPAEWLTHFEKSNYLETPNYEETINYFQKFVKNSPYAKMFTFGITPQKRELKYLVIAKNGEFSPKAAKKSNKAIVLIQSGIHSGEIEGKDASMLLLRDILITKEKEYLLDKVILLVIPVFNADGHERRSAFNRINQNGPKEMGWRTTAQNYNLNRDYLKADAPEMQAFLKLFSEWLPDFYVDSHTTDGLDFQYTVSYAIEKHQNIFHKTGELLTQKFIPQLENYLAKEGYLLAPYFDYFDYSDFSKGVKDWVSAPKLSTGYAAAQNRPSLLIETHSLKPYKDRVFSTKICFNAVLDFVYENCSQIKKINQEADNFAIENYAKLKNAVPLTFVNTRDSVMFLFKGIRSVKDSSWILGGKVTRYTNEKYELEIPYFNKLIPKDSVITPYAYFVPPEWSFIIDRLKLHGVKVDSLKTNQKIINEKIIFKNVSFEKRSFESHVQVNYDFISVVDTTEFIKGTYIIPTDQRTVKILAYLLEPISNESFLKWGFFNSIFEQKEYFEEYSMEPIARKMTEENPELKNEFLSRLQNDENFRKNRYLRLNFFYERSEYFDKNFNVYPIRKINQPIKN